MFGRNVKHLLTALFFVSVLCLPVAQARTQNFFTNSMLGLGLRAGLERAPRADFLTDPQSTKASYGPYYSFGPFLDFGNFTLRTNLALHNYPGVTATGTDASGAYSETGDLSAFAYGLQLQLNPYYSEDFRRRLYLAIGGGVSRTTVKNARSYTNGTNLTEKMSGSGQELNVGVGAETFFVQNYSVALELGYRKVTVNSFKYQKGRDLTGQERTEGEAVASQTSGRAKKLHLEGPYLAFALNLNF